MRESLAICRLRWRRLIFRLHVSLSILLDLSGADVFLVLSKGGVGPNPCLGCEWARCSMSTWVGCALCMIRSIRSRSYLSQSTI